MSEYDIEIEGPKKQVIGLRRDLDACRAENAALRRALESYARRYHANYHETRRMERPAFETCIDWLCKETRAALARGERSTDAAPDAHTAKSDGSGA